MKKLIKYLALLIDLIFLPIRILVDIQESISRSIIYDMDIKSILKRRVKDEFMMISDKIHLI